MVHIFGHGGLGGDAEIVNPQLILKRYVEGDIYGGLVLLNDNPTSVDSSQSEYSLSLFSDRFDGGIASGTGWPTPLENSHGLFQLIGLAGAATTNKKQLHWKRKLGHWSFTSACKKCGLRMGLNITSR